jgi:hypothetical protein
MGIRDRRVTKESLDASKNDKFLQDYSRQNSKERHNISPLPFQPTEALEFELPTPVTDSKKEKKVKGRLYHVHKTQHSVALGKGRYQTR